MLSTWQAPVLISSSAILWNKTELQAGRAQPATRNKNCLLLGTCAERSDLHQKGPCLSTLTVVAFQSEKICSGVPLLTPDAAQVSKLLQYSPHLRFKALEAMAHPFFDELRDPSSVLPNGESASLWSFVLADAFHGQRKQLNNKICSKSILATIVSVQISLLTEELAQYLKTVSCIS